MQITFSSMMNSQGACPIGTRAIFVSVKRRCRGAWLVYEAFRDGRGEDLSTLFLEIHGGPHAMYGYTYFHEFQMLSAEGYAIVYHQSPHGSHGYGQMFTNRVRGAMVTLIMRMSYRLLIMC
ncbi:hypothetical protein ACEQPO_24185 [Bacillus sp. SL00103]